MALFILAIPSWSWPLELDTQNYPASPPSIQPALTLPDFVEHG